MSAPHLHLGSKPQRGSKNRAVTGTALTVVEVDAEFGRLPNYRVVDGRLWLGVKHRTLHACPEFTLSLRRTIEGTALSPTASKTTHFQGA